MIYSPKYIQKIMQDYKVQFKKKFGQNFIIDENIINSIIEKAKIDKETLVIEVGPGAGSLTFKLATAAGQVIAYEIDTTLTDLLNQHLTNINNVEIIYEDFMKANIEKAVEKYSYSKIYVVANLPYYITTPILMKIIETNISVEKIVIMVQKEVGNRFKAIPGNKDYSSLSVYLSYHYQVRKLLDISRNVFLPKPNVDSIVVEMTKKEKKYQVKNESFFFQLVRDSFVQKRKNLRNNLKKYDLDKIEFILKKYNHDLTIRAEQISIEEFVDIANYLETF